MPVTDPNRRGLLGHGSILSMTSVANRTSPVLRGKYIISNLLNTPPLPPPAVVPDLEESAQKDRPSTVREQLERHRANPDVRARAIATSIRSASRWRTSTPSGSGATTTREGLAIDSAGVLADGTKVDGPVALRKALLARPDVFVGHRHREDADLRAGPRARARRHAGRPERRQGRGRAELRHAVDCAGNRAERPVPDADEVDRY